MSGPGPLPRSGPAPGAELGLASATLVGRLMAVGPTVGAGLAVTDGEGLGLALSDGLGGGVGVGTGVGGTVGRGVGTGVGGAVVGVVPRTTIVPFIVVWIEQWYANVPATANGIVLLLVPGAIGPVSNTPVSDVAVCVTPLC
jgi:hypothetical protein